MDIYEWQMEVDCFARTMEGGFVFTEILELTTIYLGITLLGFKLVSSKGGRRILERAWERIEWIF